jgi:4-hydroxy-3-methylbut-2-enyl diphosphate reductase
VPTFFIKNASEIISDKQIRHYNLHRQTEEHTDNWLPDGPLYVGITAGASCPNNLIDETICRLFELRGVNAAGVLAATQP